MPSTIRQTSTVITAAAHDIGALSTGLRRSVTRDKANETPLAADAAYELINALVHNHGAPGTYTIPYGAETGPRSDSAEKSAERAALLSAVSSAIDSIRLLAMTDNCRKVRAVVTMEYSQETGNIKLTLSLDVHRM